VALLLRYLNGSHFFKWKLIFFLIKVVADIETNITVFVFLYSDHFWLSYSALKFQYFVYRKYRSFVKNHPNKKKQKSLFANQLQLSFEEKIHYSKKQNGFHIFFENFFSSTFPPNESCNWYQDKLSHLFVFAIIMIFGRVAVLEKQKLLYLFWCQLFLFENVTKIKE